MVDLEAIFDAISKLGKVNQVTVYAIVPSGVFAKGLREICV